MGTSKVFNYEKPSIENVEFPIVCKSRNSGMIVLFSDEKSGTIIANPDKDYKLGQYNTSWTHCLKSDVWEILWKVTITFNS